jgi:catechol 2,3-dioxygenase-like lactoylglutathione lyase family enzyme
MVQCAAQVTPGEVSWYRRAASWVSRAIHARKMLEHVLQHRLTRRSSMALSYQVTFDCADPDRMARFWGEALGFKRSEPPPGFATWDAYLASIGVPEHERDGASAVVDPDGSSARIFFQRVPEAKTVKNRVHLDINITAGRATPIEQREQQVNVAVERLVSIGATVVDRVHEYDGYFVILLDPEGNEFCAH